MTQTPNKPTKRRHIPALNSQQLKLANQQIDALKLSAKTKQILKAMIGAAANPNSERPDVVLRSLEHERQQNAAQLQHETGATFTGATQRGGAALLSMSDEEWNRLIAKAHADH